MPRWGLFASLPALQLASHSPEQLNQARKNLRDQLHHIGAEGDIVEEFVEKLMEQTLADTDNLHNLEDWTETTAELNEWNGRGDVIQTDYLSPPFTLKTGGAHFTINTMYYVPVPKGDYVILNQTWQIVGGEDASEEVPLNQMYNHHWLIASDHGSPLDMCEGDYFFGGGAEYRNIDYTFMDGYGQKRVNASGQCGANLHFINTEDLAVQWEGFNNPDGNHGAAVKLAAECGWEPDRAPGICNNWGDGSFLCCFTGSRAKVNDPSNNSTRTVRLKSTFQYTRNFAGTKHLQTSLLDVGGNARSEHGQMINAISEWGVDTYLSNEGMYTRCDDKVCNATRTQVIGDGSKFGYGFCAGEMLWSYMHIHAGGTFGSMAINGQEVCTSLPVVGTDPANPPGNEQGYLVGVTQCIDHRLQGNKVRLEKGDVITLSAQYDVDPMSQRHFPMPGGKHGGIMALFFAFMDCDPGTYSEVYVTRNDTCVPVPHEKRDKVGPIFETLEECQTGAMPALLEDVKESQEPVADAVAEPETGEMNLWWRDCGRSGKSVNFTAISPSTMNIGKKTKIVASGQLSKDITTANITVKTTSGLAGLTLAAFSGEACSGSGDMWTLEDQIHLQFQPLGCPLAPGDFSAEFDFWVSPLIPTSIAHTTSTIVAHDDEGEELYCMEIVTTTGDTPNGPVEMVI
jgi:hypothetical protein